MIRTTFGLWDYVVNGEVPKLERMTAAVTDPFLLAEQGVLVGLVGDHRPLIRALRNVGPMINMTKQTQLFTHSNFY